MNFSKHKQKIINSFLISINSDLLELKWNFSNQKVNVRLKKNDSIIRYFFATLIYLKFIFFK